MTDVDIEKVQRPGAEGCAWRLVRRMDPAGVHEWLVWERAASTPAVVCATALADVLAAAAVGFVRNTTDVRDAALGPEGIDNLFGKAFRARLANRTPGGVYLPQPGGW